METGSAAESPGVERSQRRSDDQETEGSRIIQKIAPDKVSAPDDRQRQPIEEISIHFAVRYLMIAVVKAALVVKPLVPYPSPRRRLLISALAGVSRRPSPKQSCALMASRDDACQAAAPETNSVFRNSKRCHLRVSKASASQ